VPVYAVGCLVIFLHGSHFAGFTTAIAQSNPVVVRTNKTGTTAWQISDKVSTDKTGQIKVTRPPECQPGDSLNFFVTTNPPQTYRWTSIA